MDRRDSIKSLLIGSVGAGAIVATPGCNPKEKIAEGVPEKELGHYGRTPEEKQRDQEILKGKFLNDHELDTISVLTDLILPPTDGFQSASAAGVPEFIEFIVKDMEAHQLPIRGGLMWLDNFSNQKFGLLFKACSHAQQTQVLDLIAYPEEEPTELAPGIDFFALLRDLTLTGFYTSKMGMEELGYKGNTPNAWDGVPAEVLKKHGFEYDESIVYINQSRRNEIVEWDSEGNVLNN